MTENITKHTIILNNMKLICLWSIECYKYSGELEPICTGSWRWWNHFATPSLLTSLWQTEISLQGGERKNVTPGNWERLQIRAFPLSPGKILLAHHCLFISNNSLRFYLYQTSDANEKEVSINICTWQSESSKVTYLDFLKFLWKEKKNLKNQKLLQIWAAQGK